ncbi:type II toxin-antitoxin system HicB family antitoxin [Providencia sp. Me31A]|uniref:hypothetical protein n=1 Tax=Providencia sp. Me31A TaxID=3392637 RepID=UPI003D26F18E
MFNYQAITEFIEDEGIYEISFCDFPEIQGVTYCKEDVEIEAQEVLLATFAEYIAARKKIPLPSVQQDGTFTIYLPITCCLKIALSNAIIASEITRFDLARRLNINAQQIERLVDIHYASKIDILEQALYLLGYEATVGIRKKPLM